MEPVSAAVAEVDLIPSLWQELPMELLKKVLTKLPVSVLMKFLRVSKGWKEWIQSEEFGRNYDSVESTVFSFGGNGDRSYIALPSLKSDSWEKHFLEFVHEDERVAELVAVDRGLLCYKILTSVSLRFRKETLQNWASWQLSVKKMNLKGKGVGSRPAARTVDTGYSVPRGCRCHFNVYVDSKREGAMLISWMQREHVDLQNQYCHGPLDRTAIVSNAVLAPRLSKDCINFVERLLRPTRFWCKVIQVRFFG